MCNWKNFLHLATLLCCTDLFTIPGSVDAAVIQRPSRDNCDNQETLFKPNKIFTYAYSVTTSSGFFGVSDSRAGSKIACTVSLKVPRQCEVILTLSSCSISQRNSGTSESYTDIDTDFKDDLERYPLYFQTNKGRVLDKSIFADERETVQVLNIKRGILSALQFQILEASEYDKPIQETDILGSCPTKYTLLGEGINTVQTHKNLVECELRQIFLTQFSPFTSNKQVVGGYLEDDINEAYYPFGSHVKCNHTLNGRQQMARVTCLQVQYFKPTAYMGEELATAMTQVWQDLQLTDVSNADLPNPDLSGTGQVVVDIRFDMDMTSQVTELDTVRSEMNSLLDTLAMNSYTYEDVPERFQSLVFEMRDATYETLLAFNAEVFDCPKPCIDSRKSAGMKLFLDGLQSCGTDACLRMFIDNVGKQRVSNIQTAMFMVGLSQLTIVSEELVTHLYDICSSMFMDPSRTFETNCMLHVGSLISHLDYPGDGPLPDGSIAQRVLSDLHAKMAHACDEQTGLTERQYFIATQALDNVGPKLASRFFDQLPFVSKTLNCLKSAIVPLTVKRALLKTKTLSQMVLMEEGQSSQPLAEGLFTLLEDPTQHLTLRTNLFALLAETVDHGKIERLITKMEDQQDMDQLRAYMKTFVRTLLDKTHPHLEQIVQTWKTILQEKTTDLHSQDDLDPYDRGTSRSLNFQHFMKFYFTEMFGGDLYADVVYEPGNYANKVAFSTARVGVNYLFKDELHNIAEAAWFTHGTQQVNEILTRHTELSMKEFLGMVTAARYGQMPESSHVAHVVTRFQENIVKAVHEILQSVPAPDLKDFDAGFEFKLRGKHVFVARFGDFMMVRYNPAAFQGYLKQLLTGMNLVFQRGVEFGSLIKVIPTCAGLTLNHTVTLTGFARVFHNLQSNAIMYLSGSAPTLTLAGLQRIAFTVNVVGKLVVPIGLHTTQSGMNMNIHLGSERGMNIKVKYGHDNVLTTVENPTRKRLELELQPIEELRNSEEILYARSTMQLLHNTDIELLSNSPTVQASLSQCMDDKMALTLGRIFCADFSFANVSTSNKHAYFPLSGPFELSVKMSKVDMVTWYDLIFEYGVEQNEGGGLEDKFTLSHSGPGTRLQRTWTSTLTYDRKNRILHIDDNLPELQFGYTLNYNFNPAVQGFSVMEIFSLHGHPVLGYDIRLMSDKKLRDWRFNVTLPNWGFDLHHQTVNTKVTGDRVDEQTWLLSFTYKCNQTLPMLFMLHPLPAMAIENGDTTHFSWHRAQTNVYNGIGQRVKEVANVRFEFNGKDLTGEVVTDLTRISSTRHGTFYYQIDGIQKSLVVDREMVLSKTESGLMYDITQNLVWENSDVSLHYGLTFTPKRSMDIFFTADYNNKELSRQRRSVQGLYDQLKLLENEFVDEATQLEDAVLSHISSETHADSDDQSHLGHHKSRHGGRKPRLAELQDVPSIWERPSWHTDIKFQFTLNPVFPAGMTPDQSRPIAMELVVHGEGTHPWDGNERSAELNLRLGKNLSNNFKAFHFWLTGDLFEEYTLSDGTVDRQNTYDIDIHVDRRAGAIFDYRLKYKSPKMDTDYVILFDWEAYTHDDPLVQVKSKFQSELLPMLCHSYDESLYYVPGHIKHSMVFNHLMLNASLYTDLSNGYADLVQNGSLSWQLGKKRNAVTINSQLLAIPGAPPHVPKQLEVRMVHDSVPDVIRVYTLQLAGRRAIQISTAVIMPTDPVATLLWTRHIQVRGSSLLELTFTFTPAADKLIQEMMSTRLITVHKLLKGLAIHTANNAERALLDKTIFLTNTTVQAMIQMLTGRFRESLEHSFDNFLRNFIPLHLRPHKEVRGVIVPPRIAYMYQLIHQPREAAPIMRKLSYLRSYALLATSYAFSLVQTLHGTELVQQAIQNRQFTTAIDLHLNGNPMSYQVKKEGAKHMANLLLGVPVNKTRGAAVGTVFGQNDNKRDLHFRTFDGLFHFLDASSASECSYLLAGDVAQQKFSVVLTPSGITLISQSLTVSIDWDGSVHLDQCKLASIEDSIVSDDGLVSVKLDGSSILVDTELGVKLHCDLDAVDVCYVTLDGYVNGTAGLLGNNDKDRFTDKLMIDWRCPNIHEDGMCSQANREFVAQFVLAGPDTCKDTSPKVSTSQISEPTPSECSLSECLDKFYSARGVSDGLSLCNNELVTAELQAVLDQCKIDADSCVDDGADVCYMFRTIQGLCREKGFSEYQLTIPDECAPLPAAPLMLDSASSLDIVFVLSQHASMAEYGNQPWEYVQELVDNGDEFWAGYQSVRVGTVTFGGDTGLDPEEPSIGYIVNGNNRYFEDLDVLDWDHMRALTATGQSKADGFKAVGAAAKFPFRPTASKMIVLLITKEQTSGDAGDLDTLTSELKSQDIILNVVSTYAKVSSRRVIGITWDEQIITKDSGYGDHKNLPTTDYIHLIRETHGALFSLDTLGRGRSSKVSRIVEEFYTQTSVQEQTCRGGSQGGDSGIKIDVQPIVQ